MSEQKIEFYDGSNWITLDEKVEVQFPVKKIPEALNHIPTCKANMHCIKCGRAGCIGCILGECHYPTFIDLQKIGMCVICAGLWTEDKILLYPPNKEKVKKGRLLRLEEKDGRR